jgi:purine nucleosidase
MNPTLLLSMLAAAGLAATGISSSAASSPEKIRVILDTDANNELDDQHAIAYLLFNGDVFDVEAITVNRTRAGGGVDQHLAEALRVVRLCGLEGQIPVLLGADKSFEEIRGQLDRPDFDGAEAVNFIIERAKATDGRRLVLLPVGKLTNIALALEKDPSIIPKVRVVWLGSNYPKRGEYNKENDVESLNYILETEVEFEIATVRYGAPSGTDAVRATLAEIRQIMPGKGPKVDPPVTGRHGGEFTNFGDYAVSLFENIRLYGDPPSRALFDMAAVAIVKNPAWATAVEMPAPILKGRLGGPPGQSAKDHPVGELRPQGDHGRFLRPDGELPTRQPPAGRGSDSALVSGPALLAVQGQARPAVGRVGSGQPVQPPEHRAERAGGPPGSAGLGRRQLSFATRCPAGIASTRTAICTTTSTATRSIAIRKAASTIWTAGMTSTGSSSATSSI